MFTAVLIDFGFRKIWTHLYLKYKYGRNQKKHIKILILVTFDQVLWMNVLSTFKYFYIFQFSIQLKKRVHHAILPEKIQVYEKCFAAETNFYF